MIQGGASGGGREGRERGREGERERRGRGGREEGERRKRGGKLALQSRGRTENNTYPAP